MPFRLPKILPPLCKSSEMLYASAPWKRYQNLAHEQSRCGKEVGTLAFLLCSQSSAQKTETDTDRWLKGRDRAAQGQGTCHMSDPGLFHTSLQGAPESTHSHYVVKHSEWRKIHRFNSLIMCSSCEHHGQGSPTVSGTWTCKNKSICVGWYESVGTQSSEIICGVRIDKESYRCRKSSPKVNILEYEKEEELFYVFILIVYIQCLPLESVTQGVKYPG